MSTIRKPLQFNRTEDQGQAQLARPVNVTSANFETIRRPKDVPILPRQ
jgi:hypothetical protein